MEYSPRSIVSGTTERTEGAENCADETLDLTNRILDKIDQEMSQLHMNTSRDFQKTRKANTVDTETIGGETGSCVDDCLSTEKEFAHFNDSVSSVADLDRFPKRQRPKRSRSALGRLNNHDKSLEAEELLKGLIEKKYPMKESPDSTPRSDLISDVMETESSPTYKSVTTLGRSLDLGHQIKARINGCSEVESVISRDLQAKIDAVQNFRMGDRKSNKIPDPQPRKKSLDSMTSISVSVAKPLTPGTSFSNLHAKTPNPDFRGRALNLHASQTLSKYSKPTQGPSYQVPSYHGPLNSSTMSERLSTSNLFSTKRTLTAPHHKAKKPLSVISSNESIDTCAKSFTSTGFPRTDFNKSSAFPTLDGTSSFSMVFKEPPTVLSYTGNPKRMDRWQSHESLASTIEIEPPNLSGSRSRNATRDNKYKSGPGSRSQSQPAGNDIKRSSKNGGHSNSRFAEFVPRSYEASEVGSATEKEIELIKAEAARIKSEMETSRMSNSIANNGVTFERNRNSAQSSSSSMTLSTPRSSQPGSHGVLSAQPATNVIQREAERSMEKLKDLDREVQNILSKKQNVMKEYSELQVKKSAQEDEIRENDSEIRKQKLVIKNEKHSLELLKEERTKIEGEVGKVKKDLVEARESYNNQLEMGTQQVLQLIEENNLLKEALHKGEINQFERYEMHRQVTDLREELRAQENDFRCRNSELCMELSEADKRLRQYDETNRELVMRLENLDKEFAEKVKNVNEINSFVKGELSDTKNNLSQLAEEHEVLKKQSLEQNEKLVGCQNLLSDRESDIHDLKSVNDNLNLEMHAFQMKSAEQLSNLETELTKEKENAVDELQCKIADLNKKYEGKLSELRSEIDNMKKEKAKEVEFWKNKLNSQEEATRELGERLRIEAQEQVRTAIAHERSNWEDEKVVLLRRERDNFDDELSRTVKRLQDAVDYEKNLLKQSQRHCAELKSEVEELRNENRKLHKEATDAYISARESTQREHSNELSNLREQLVSEHNREVFELQEKLRGIEDELETTKIHQQNETNRNIELETRVVQHEKAVLLELNEECRRICKIISINFNRIKKKRTCSQNEIEAAPVLPTSSTNALINGTTEALINLKACVSELQTYVYELKDNFENEKLKNQHMKERHEISIRTLRDELNIEKTREIDDLKEKLHHAHVKELTKMQEALIDEDMASEIRDLKKENAEMKGEMSRFKKDTAERLARQFELEVEKGVKQRMNSEQRSLSNRVNFQQKVAMQKQVACESPGEGAKKVAPVVVNSVIDSKTSIQLLRHLQERVNALKDENTRLKHSISMNSSSSCNGVPPMAAPPSDF